MKQPPAFQLYARDFLGEETWGLSLEATGAYIRLLCQQWLKGSLEADVAALAKQAGVKPTQKFQRAWREIEALFPVSPADGYRRNPELELKRAETLAYRQRQAKLGIKGARARWLKPLP